MVLTFDELVERLPGGGVPVVGRSDQRLMFCPCHPTDDQPYPDLFITDLSTFGQPPLLWCHLCHLANADSRREILRSGGVDWSDLYGQSDDKVPVAIYYYVDERGEVQHAKRRGYPKEFTWWHLARQRRAPGLGDARRLPYRLPELRTALDGGQRVYVGEGEKDVDALRRAGVAATTMGSAGTVFPEEFLTMFTDADVVVIADNDDPGKASGRKLADQLSVVTLRVQVVTAKEGGSRW